MGLIGITDIAITDGAPGAPHRCSRRFQAGSCCSTSSRRAATRCLHVIRGSVSFCWALTNSIQRVARSKGQSELLSSLNQNAGIQRVARIRAV